MLPVATVWRVEAMQITVVASRTRARMASCPSYTFP